VIEIDGEHHAFQQEADARRTAMMEHEGWRVVRFWANHVVENPGGVWEEIELLLKEPPHLTSPPRGERNMKV
jgi:very-short-patch-repair endonuclease